MLSVVVCVQYLAAVRDLVDITKQDVVVIALGSLQGATDVVDTEDVAIAAHALAPVAFGWRKHTEHIDLERVRISLQHEKEAADPRVAGSVRAGWYLTDYGRGWLRQNSSLAAQAELSVAVTPVATAKKRAETRRPAEMIDRILSSPAYKAWAAGQPIPERQAAAVFRIDEYTPARDRQLKTARISELVADDPNLADFISVAIPLALALSAPNAKPTQTSK